MWLRRISIEINRRLKRPEIPAATLGCGTRNQSV
jgi:hypothetical protein